MNYALIFTYNFDQDCEVLLFNTWEEASTKLKEYAEEEFRIEAEENEYDSELVHDDDWSYAEVISHFDEADDICYYHVAHIA